jgi:hypothetical protein
MGIKKGVGCQELMLNADPLRRKQRRNEAVSNARVNIQFSISYLFYVGERGEGKKAMQQGKI